MIHIDVYCILNPYYQFISRRTHVKCIYAYVDRHVLFSLSNLAINLNTHTCQMLSLSLLDTIIALDWQSTWLRFMSQKGYLQNLCASIQWEDEGLQKMLSPMPEALKALYIYESKMVSEAL